MITKENKKLAQWAMEYALKNGCQASRVQLYNGSSNSFEVRDMKIDRLQQASENSLAIQLFVDGRFGTYSTNRLDKMEIERFIKEGIATTRFLAEDEARTLPDASRYYKGGQPDLQLRDPDFEKVNPDEMLGLAMQTCAEMQGKDERIISANSSFSSDEASRYLVASNGFEGETTNSTFSLVASLSIRGEGEARPESYWYDAALYFKDLKKEGIGRKALERVLNKLGQRKAASGKYTMVVDNMNAANLLSPLIEALDGSAIQQKNSFLLDKLGQKVLSEKIVLTDEPHIAKAMGARYFDNEGVATKRMPIFEQGVLRTYFIDTYRANKMGVEPTISSPSLLVMQPGATDLNGLIGGIDKGILVTGFNGGNCNSTTGDFSYGVEGFLIDKGRLAHPVSEMNVTGNMLTLWGNVAAIGNDPRFTSSWRIPSMAFGNVDFSGL